MVSVLPSVEFGANDGPFVPDLIMQLYQPLLVGEAPLLLAMRGVDMRGVAA